MMNLNNAFFGQLMRRAAILALLFGLFAVTLTTRAAAAGYPDRPIKLIAGATSGSGGDVMARLVAAELSKELGQPIIIENKPGAAGNIAAAFVAGSKPDGHTILFGYTGHVINPSLPAPLPFDPIKDFTPIAMLASNWTVLVVKRDSPAKSVADLVAMARKKPGTMSVGVLLGSITHMASELMFSELGLDVLNVPFKSNNDAVTSMMGGNVDFVFSTFGAVEGLLQNGQLRALASTEPKRTDLLPGIPTMAETIPGFAVTGWYGLLGPKDMPTDVVATLNAAVAKVLRAPDMRAKLAKMGSQANLMSPSEFGAFISAEIPRWQKVAKKAKIQ